MSGSQEKIISGGQFRMKSYQQRQRSSRRQLVMADRVLQLTYYRPIVAVVAAAAGSTSMGSAG